MDAPSLKRAASAATMGIGGLLWLAAILSMAQTAQNSEQFSRLHPWILMINIAGLAVLVGLLATKLAQLIRDWRGHVIGSRLKARMVWIFGVLATLPILLVYFFAVQFLNRGIDSWFNVEIRKSLDDALVLSRSALEVRMREHLADTELIGDEIGDRGQRHARHARNAAAPGRRARNDGRHRHGHDHLGEQGHVVGHRAGGRARRSAAAGAARPAVREPRAAAGRRLPDPHGGADQSAPGRATSALVLQVMYPVAERLGALADTVQAAYQQFGEKDYLRKPLKASFILTLTVVLLLSLLAAWYGAIFTAQRLVQPIQDLVQGTRAVAQGDLDTKLPLTSHDEMGFLVHSFNDMTRAPAPRTRRPAPRAAGGRNRARQPRRDPRAPVDRRDLAASRTGACARRIAPPA